MKWTCTAWSSNNSFTWSAIFNTHHINSYFKVSVYEIRKNQGYIQITSLKNITRACSQTSVLYITEPGWSSFATNSKKQLFYIHMFVPILQWSYVCNRLWAEGVRYIFPTEDDHLKVTTCPVCISGLSQQIYLVMLCMITTHYSCYDMKGTDTTVGMIINLKAVRTHIRFCKRLHTSSAT